MLPTNYLFDQIMYWKKFEKNLMFSSKSWHTNRNISVGLIFLMEGREINLLTLIQDVSLSVS